MPRPAPNDPAAGFVHERHSTPVSVAGCLEARPTAHCSWLDRAPLRCSDRCAVCLSRPRLSPCLSPCPCSPPSASPCLSPPLVLFPSLAALLSPLLALHHSYSRVRYGSTDRTQCKRVSLFIAPYCSTRVVERNLGTPRDRQTPAGAPARDRETGCSQRERGGGTDRET